MQTAKKAGASGFFAFIRTFKNLNTRTGTLREYKTRHLCLG